MANFIDLDSTYRNINTYPNPASYTVEDKQVSTWPRAPRNVSNNSNRPGSNSVEYATSLHIRHLILPYTTYTYVDKTGATITSHTADLQRIYLDIRNSNFNDRQMLLSIDNVVGQFKFVLTREQIQFDSTGNPAWIHFGARMDQAMRFSRDKPVTINIAQENGYTIIITDTTPTPNPALQTYILSQVTPYFRDGAFQNQGVGLTQF